MRQVFTSQRMETVEGVAKLLTDAGIEVHVANQRSYQSKRSGQFSYTEPVAQKQQPSLWVRHADDQPRAREILRAAGLLESTRPGITSALTFAAPPEEVPARSHWALRIRLGLLALIALAAVLTVMRHRPPASTPVSAPASSPPAAPAEPAEEEVRVQVKPSGG